MQSESVSLTCNFKAISMTVMVFSTIVRTPHIKHSQEKVYCCNYSFTNILPFVSECVSGAYLFCKYFLIRLPP